MQLLEINYTEKYDTFTGYLANVPDYFRYEVDRDKVELTLIDEQFYGLQDFIKKTMKTNPDASFLIDPLHINEINYKELEHYKRLSLPTLDRQSWITTTFGRKIVTTVAFLLLLSGAFFYSEIDLFTENSENIIVIPVNVEPRDEIQYFYKIQLINGGTLEGIELQQDSEKILIKNKKGLEVILELPTVMYIEKIQQDNSVSRSVIYGMKP